MTKFTRKALSLLFAHGPARAEDLATELWPGRKFKSPAKGGPWGGAVAASFALGRIRSRSRFVQYDGDGKWRITAAGSAALAKGER